MKHLLCTFTLILAGCLVGSAQKKITVSVKSEVTFDKVLPTDMLYEYDGFKQGKLYNKGTGMAVREYNFNLLSGNCAFKDQSGRVLEVASPELVVMVVIDGDRWYWVDDCFGKLIYKNAEVEVIKVRKTLCTDLRKEGAYGGTSSTAAITNITSFRAMGNTTHKLSILGEYDFEVKVEYFLRKGGDTEPLSAKGLRKFFPNQKNRINDFLKSRRVSQMEERDVIELVKSIASE